MIVFAALLLAVGTPDYCYNEWLEGSADDGCDIIGDFPIGGGPDPMDPGIKYPDSGDLQTPHKDQPYPTPAPIPTVSEG